MGKRDSEGTFEAILSGARKVLARDGHDGFSLRKVADECGLRLGSVQYYFPSKDALFDACLREQDDWVNSLISSGQQAVRDGESVRSVMTRATLFSFHGVRQQRSVTRLRVDHVNRNEDRLMLPELRRTAIWLAEQGIPRDQGGLIVHTLVVAVVRYASWDATTLMAATLTETESAAIAAVETHLTALVAALIPEPPT
ncbi:MAG: TetR/AcrR family transcriptional regulator [Polyangiaceae bacterium]|nr:TetR/AcrR family transcriptional regulator [Polyangiaceae bacterium]